MQQRRAQPKVQQDHQADGLLAITLLRLPWHDEKTLAAESRSLALNVGEEGSQHAIEDSGLLKVGEVARPGDLD